MQDLDNLCTKLIGLSHAESTYANIQAHCRAYCHFCQAFQLTPFPVSQLTIFRYIAYLVQLGRAFGTITNHLSSIKHVHKFLGYPLTWDTNYHYKLMLKGCQRFLGVAPKRKSAMMPHILYDIYCLLDLRTPLHSALWALCLVAFFTFLRKSNLVLERANRPSPKVPLRQDLCFHAKGATLTIRATKTIQFKQRYLSIPLPYIPDSPLCPVTALRNHLQINDLNDKSDGKPLFSVILPRSGEHAPITAAKFSAFIQRAIKTLGLDPGQFSPHSFRRGGATFAFSCSVPSELIQRQGDWHSDAYLVYLEMSDAQKLQASETMARRIQPLF